MQFDERARAVPATPAFDTVFADTLNSLARRPEHEPLVFALRHLLVSSPTVVGAAYSCDSSIEACLALMLTPELDREGMHELAARLLEAAVVFTESMLDEIGIDEDGLLQGEAEVDALFTLFGESYERAAVARVERALVSACDRCLFLDIEQTSLDVWLSTLAIEPPLQSGDFAAPLELLRELTNTQIAAACCVKALEYLNPGIAAFECSAWIEFAQEILEIGEFQIDQATRDELRTQLLEVYWRNGMRSEFSAAIADPELSLDAVTIGVARGVMVTRHGAWTDATSEFEDPLAEKHFESELVSLFRRRVETAAESGEISVWSGMTLRSCARRLLRNMEGSSALILQLAEHAGPADLPFIQLFAALDRVRCAKDTDDLPSLTELVKECSSLEAREAVENGVGSAAPNGEGIGDVMNLLFRELKPLSDQESAGISARIANAVGCAYVELVESAYLDPLHPRMQEFSAWLSANRADEYAAELNAPLLIAELRALSDFDFDGKRFAVRHPSKDPHREIDRSAWAIPFNRDGARVAAFDLPFDPHLDTLDDCRLADGLGGSLGDLRVFLERWIAVTEPEARGTRLRAIGAQLEDTLNAAQKIPDYARSLELLDIHALLAGALEGGARDAQLQRVAIRAVQLWRLQRD